MQPITVWRVDPSDDLFMYAEPVYPDADGEYVVPAHCVLVETPPTAGLERPKWVSNVDRMNPQWGRPGSGEWSIVLDYRSSTLYMTADGEKYTVGEDADGKKYEGVGPLPDWLTDRERPGPFHHWIDDAWVLNEAEELADAKQRKITELSQACQAQIFEGFKSAALGAVHHYPALALDQQNLTASVLDSTIPGLPEDWTTPFWCEIDGEWAFRLHTAAQIQQVGRDGKTRILRCMGQNESLASMVRQAQTLLEVEQIVWSDPDI